MSTQDFSTRLILWQRQYGRHHLPWQNTRDAYRIWLSEIMLQQTQVSTVIPYFERFVARFPSVNDLADASQEEVMSYWSGLGYYSRARNLHKAAKIVSNHFGGQFPKSVEALSELPGIGRSTAAAIAAFSFGIRAAILDGNVKRVLARHAGVEGYPGEGRVQQQLWQEADKRLPLQGIEAYTQGLMDLGNMICIRRKPLCSMCPVSNDCLARLNNTIDLIPAPRPKKIVPVKACRMIVVLCAGKVLLIERLSTGVWQGLLSVPEVDLNASVIDLLRHDYGLAARHKVDWKSFDHVFSHYRLQIYPSIYEVDSASAVNDKPARWLPLDQIDDAPLPAPVRRLLESVQQLVV